MRYDFCFVTYNSARWLDGCVRALAAMDYDLTEVGLYFADNASTDDTLSSLRRLQSEYGPRFGAFEVLPQNSNGGFGVGSNAAARAGSGDFVFFCNVDTEIHADALRRLDDVIGDSDESWGAFELRQFPYEHPKYYNPITLETSWASGACMVLRREVFVRTGGFDESIFMYAEDVDLSWRIRLEGWRIRYVPSASITHYAYRAAGEVKPNQVAGSIAGNWMLRQKFGSRADRLWWYPVRLLSGWRLRGNSVLRSGVSSALKKVRSCRGQYAAFRAAHPSAASVASFRGLDYEFARAGAFYENRRPTSSPRFSVVIRTFRRPQVLALTLESLTHQTYRNFEVVVVEDGERPVSRETVLAFDGRLDIRYVAANAAAGRCRAANLGMEASSSEWICLLDDDDYFFAEHLEAMALQIETHPGCRFFVADSVEGRVGRVDAAGDDFGFDILCKRDFRELKPMDFVLGNPSPIQAIVFARELFRERGGIDERIPACEDWELWSRYAGQEREIVSLAKATSVFRLPDNPKEQLARALRYDGGEVTACRLIAERNGVKVDLSRRVTPRRGLRAVLVRICVTAEKCVAWIAAVFCERDVSVRNAWRYAGFCVRRFNRSVKVRLKG